MWDLNVRTDLVIYGRKHRLVDCDAFTRDYLEGQGVRVPPKEPRPQDEYRNQRTKAETFVGRRVTRRATSARSVRHDDPPVLRFFGCWEDATNPEAKEARNLSIHYFLEDDTVEVVERHGTNCGRHKAPLFLKRAKLPKRFTDLVCLPGAHSAQALLNVVRSQGPGRIRDAVLVDNLDARNDDDASRRGDRFYRVEDFDVGQAVAVAGRNVLIYDCDDVTKQYYMDHFNKALEPLREDPPIPSVRPKWVPPYTGLGSEEDSLTSCQGLEPRPPHRDFHKFMNKDRIGYESNVLRFSARLVENDAVNVRRKFVISYFLSDDTILINHIPDANTGLHAGRFLHRGKIRKPDLYDAVYGPEYFTSLDLFVGAIVKFNDHTFLLTGADDYVFEFMERREECEKYPHSNIRLILEKLDMMITPEKVKELMASFMANDPDDIGQVSENQFRQVLRAFSGYALSEHETLTLLRHLRKSEVRDPQLTPDHVLVAMLQTELRNAHFSAFADVLATCQAKDVAAAHTLNKATLRHTLVAGLAGAVSGGAGGAGGGKAAGRAHIVRDIIDAILDKYPDGEISYSDVIDRLDWTRFPTRPVPPQVVQSNFYSLATQNEHSPILYRMLVADLEKRKGIVTADKLQQLEDASKNVDNKQ